MKYLSQPIIDFSQTIAHKDLYDAILIKVVEYAIIRQRSIRVQSGEYRIPA